MENSKLMERENKPKAPAPRTVTLKALNVLKSVLDSAEILDEIYIGTVRHFSDKRISLYWQKYVGYCFIPERLVHGVWHNTILVNIDSFKSIESMSNQELETISMYLPEIFDALSAVLRQRGGCAE
jgi:hypothetical protein